MPRKKSTFPILSWPGKTRSHCREIVPLYVRELHGEEGIVSDGWRNLLIQADNLRILSSLCHGPMRKELDKRGGVKLIYCDPPFAVGSDFTLPVSNGKASAGTKEKETRLLAYRDQWQDGLSGFLNMMFERLLLMRKLLAQDGSLYLHCDHRAAPHLRLLLDEIFGPDRFLGDIVWHYTGGGRSKRWFSRKHDRILHYAVSDAWHFDPDAVRVPYKPTSGYARGGITSAAGKHYSPHPLGTPSDDVWDIPMVNPLARERCGYPTQKPLALLERIILASSRPGDLVADFFCGSGTTALCAERLGRSWIAVDSGLPAIHATRKRLSGLTAANEKKAANRQLQPYALVCADTPPKVDVLCSQKTFRHTAHLAGGSIAYQVSGIEIARHDRKGALSLELTNLALSPLTCATDTDIATENEKVRPDAFPFPERAWPEWLDYWSIGLCAEPAPLPEGMDSAPVCTEIIWESFRSDNVGPTLRSPFLSLPNNGQKANVAGKSKAVLVTLVDVFCNESRALITVP